MTMAGAAPAIVLLLASRSPRRLSLLREAGFEVRTIPSGIDDLTLAPGRVTVAQWTVALAHLKARAARRCLSVREGIEARAQADSGAREISNAPGEAIIIGADTLVEVDGRIISQPLDAADARRIILELSEREHEVLTGVSLIHQPSMREVLFVDAARVSVGRIPNREIESYVASGQWRGKAGAYNLAERLAAGWPIEYEGDPATIMGLPMRRLTRCLTRRWGIHPRTPDGEAE